MNPRISQSYVLPLLCGSAVVLLAIGCNDDSTTKDTNTGATTTTTSTTTTAAAASASAAGTVTAKDQAFVHEANMAGIAEIKTSELVIKRGAATDILAFAKQMVKDHTAANEDLAAVAKTKGITLATEPDAKTQEMLDKLAALPDSEIMAKYVEWQTSAHKDAVALFKGEAKSGGDPDITRFAAKTEPTLEEHLTHVESLTK